MPTRPARARPDADARKRDTAQEILDVAERLVRSRGFNAVSYADVAAELGITKASLHYHFASKAELGHALIARYAERFAASLELIDREASPAPAKLAAYAGLYASALRGRRMCLCGMLAAEYQTLPKPITEAVVAFFDDNEAWVAHVLEQGRAESSLSYDGSARDTARMIVSSLEGAMLVARPYGDVERFDSTVESLLARFAHAE